MIYKFCIELEKLVKNPAYSAYKIFHYTSQNPQKRSNAGLLMGAFQIIVLRRSAVESFQVFSSVPSFLEFRDAGYGACTYKCTILHCLKGLEKGIQLNWFAYDKFNVQEYEFYEKVENGDWNWVIPGKMLAFASPSPSKSDQDGFKVWTPEDYAPLFRSIGVTSVVRLNNKTYEAERFTRNGIKHYDLYFLDGSVPSDQIISDFLKIAESETGALAIHCKAGLGRTGTLIGLYAIKHFGFEAADFIGWIRLCRPGSVLGPQQQFLCEMEEVCKRWGTEFRGKSLRVNTAYKEESKFEMSPEEMFVSQHGDYGQAERLVSAKKNNQSSPNTPVLPNKSPVLSQRPSSQTPNTNVKKQTSTNNSIFAKAGTKAPSTVRSPVQSKRLVK
jgi:cell division cycle 14